MPDSIRRFDIDLDKVGSFGKYTLEGNFGYGTTGQLLASQVTFYVVPLAVMIIGGSVSLLIIFLIILLPKMLKSYNRRVIRRASRRRY